jgi:hypothetical protein
MNGRMPVSGRHVLVLPVVAAAVLVPWTIGIATHLPHSAVAHHWNTAWAGLDVAIMVGLVLTSWAGPQTGSPCRAGRHSDRYVDVRRCLVRRVYERIGVPIGVCRR